MEPYLALITRINELMARKGMTMYQLARRIEHFKRTDEKYGIFEHHQYLQRIGDHSAGFFRFSSFHSRKFIG
mgnify:CR=1 FL=1